MHYYQILFSNDYAKRNGKYASVETSPEPDDLYIISDNSTFPFNEVEKYKFVINDGIYADWQMCLYPWRIISQEFKEVLELFKDGYTYFHPIKLYSDDNRYKKYYILHFAKTIGFNEDQCLNKVDTIKKYNFQAFDDAITGTFFVSEVLKNEILKNKLTGLYFLKIF